MSNLISSCVIHGSQRAAAVSGYSIAPHSTVTILDDPDERHGSQGIHLHKQGAAVVGAFYFGPSCVVNAGPKDLVVLGCYFYHDVPTKWDFLGWFRLLRWVRKEILRREENALGTAIKLNKDLEQRGH